MFLNDYLHADLKLSVREATAVMASFSFGTFVGMIFGGHLGQRLYNWRSSAAAAHAALTEAASAVPLAAIVLAATPHTPLSTYCPIALLGGFLASQTGVILRACLQNVAAPTHRALAFGAFAIFDDVGKGGGPVVVASLVKAMGRKKAFGIAIIAGWLLGAGINSLLVLTLEGDERRLRWMDLAAADDYSLELPMQLRPSRL